MPTLKVAIDASKALQGANIFASAAKTINVNAQATIGNVNQVNNSFARSGQAVGSAIPGFTSMLRVFLGLLGIRQVIRTLSDFETGIVGVIKTTNMAPKEAKKFEDQIISLSTKLPIATSELLEIAKAAGQLGVRGNANLMLFTETIGKMGVAANVHGESAATRLAQILNITGESVQNVKILADAIVNLGNNSAVAGAESQILRIANEVARGTASFRVNSLEVAGLAAAYGQLGVRAESAGTASFKVFRFLEQASREKLGAKNDAALKRASSVLGVDPDEFKRQFGESSASTFKEFVTGLGRIQSAGGNVNQVLDEMDLKDNRLRKSIQGLANNTTLLAKTFDLAKNSGGALDREASLAFGTLSRQWQLFKNTLGAAILQLRDQRGIMADTLGTITQAIRITLDLEKVSDKTTETTKNLAVGFRLVGHAIHDTVEAFAVLIGVRDPLQTTSVAVDALVIGMKALLAVFVVYEAIKIVQVLDGARIAILGLGKGLAGNVTTASLLLVVLLGIGAALLGWSLGKTFIDQFKWLQKTVEWLSYMLAKIELQLSSTGARAQIQSVAGSAPGVSLSPEGAAERIARQQLADEQRRRGQRPTTRPSDDQELKARMKSILGAVNPDELQKQFDQLEDMHKKSMAQIDAGIGLDGGASGKDFWPNLQDNMKKSVDDMTSGMTGFISSGLGVRQVIKLINQELERNTGQQKKNNADYESAAEIAISELEKQKELIGQLPAKHDEIIERRKIEDELIKESVLSQEEMSEQLDVWASKFREIQQLKEESKINTSLKDLKFDSELFGLHDDALEIEVQKRQILNEVRRQGIPISQEEIDKVDQQVTSVHRLQKEWEKVWSVADKIGESFGRAFEDAIFAAKDWRDATIGFVKEVAQAIFHEYVTNAIVKAIVGSVGSAFGPKTGGGTTPNSGVQTTKFAEGGTIMSPTFFAYNGGRMGLAGEAGIEHLVPDDEYKSMQRGGGTTKIYQTVNISTPNPSGFNRSKRQIQETLRKAVM